MGVAPRRLDDERGSALPELAIAMLVLSVAILGVVGSMGLGMQLVGSSRQQSSGTSVASERLERIHDMPYKRIATSAEPTHSEDPEHPDHDVSLSESDCPTPDMYPCLRLQDGSYEPLVFFDPEDPDSPDGALSPEDDPITVGNTEFKVFQYVTSVDVDDPPDGVEDARRVTVVVVWKHPVQSGTTDRAIQSSIITPGTVTITPSPTPSPTPTPTPGPTPTPAPDCVPPGDDGWGFGAGAGTMDILSGSGAQTGYTGMTTIQISLDPKDDDFTESAELSNDGTAYYQVATWDPTTGELLPATVTWTIPPGDGLKTIQARFKNTDGQCSQTLSQDITLDQTLPAPVSSDLVATGPPTASGPSSCLIEMTWGGSTDPTPQGGDNLLGYRLYRSIDSEPFEAISTVGSTSASDTVKKTHNSIRYLVRAYDKAGNESDDSNILSFSKNSC